MRARVHCLVFFLSIFVFWPCSLAVAGRQSVTVQITGTVHPPAGMRSLPPGTEVSLDNGWGHSQSQLVTGGHFEFSRMPPGTYTVRVRAQGFQSAEQIVSTEPHSGTGCHVEIRLGTPVSGENNPPAGASTVPLAALRIPKTAHREFDKGRDDYLKGRLESALRHFQAASAACPDWPQPYAAQGLAHIDLKQTAEAEAALRRATALHPEWYVPWKHLGYLFLTTGRFEEALENLDRARKIHPSDALTFTYSGEALYQLGRHGEAGEAFKEALRLNQGDVQAAYRLGYALLQQGQAGEALTAFEAFLRRHPGVDPGDVKQIVTRLRSARENLSKPK